MVADLLTVQPGDEIGLTDQGLQFPAQVILGVELALVHLQPNDGQQAVGPLPGIQRIAIPAGVDLEGTGAFPVEPEEVAFRLGKAGGAGQGFTLEFAVTLGALFLGQDGAFHAQASSIG